MSKYVIGIDYGTLSARALMVDLSNGAEVAAAEYVYPHAVMKSEHFQGITLDKAAALQHPMDYLQALEYTVKEVIDQAGVAASDIVGMGIDFTSCTVLPVTEDGTPLCFLEKYKNEPHAYVKLWKHHGGQKEADEITRIAKEEGVSWLETYGNKVSSEWLFPKILETCNKAPEVYDEAARFIEAADWLVWQITGEEIHSSCMAGFKNFWDKKNGYPSNDFWAKVHPKMGDIIGTKISENVSTVGTKAGEINKRGAELTGLQEGTAVAVPVIDAHAALPAAGVVEGGKMVMIIGTSGCHILLSEEEKNVKGICGRVADGIIPGYIAYEAGQSCVGDSFDWFIKNCVPERYAIEARECNKNIFTYMTEKAEKLEIGQSGILVLDWWNGNRTPLADFELTGVILGLTLQTKPEEIYRGIIESTAFGTKAIIDLYEENDVKIEELYAAGGISQKNTLLMQIYADVLGRDIKVTKSSQAGAKGSAVFAAAASDYFGSIKEAAQVIADECECVYHPIPGNTLKYKKLYDEYVTLTNYFGRGENNVMKRLKENSTNE